MKRLKAWMEPRYTKIAIYAIVSAVIVFAACLLLMNSNGALLRAYALAGAVMKPLVLGMVIAYLLLPVVKLLENKVFKGIKGKKARRNLAVILIYVLIAAIIGLLCTLLVVTVTKGISSLDVSLSSLESMAQSLQKDFDEFWKIIEGKLADLNINLGSVGKTAAAIFGDIKSGASTILFALIFSIYFLMDSGIRKYWGKAARTLLKEKTRESLKCFMKDADRVFAGYIRGQTLDAMIMGSMVTIAFLIAGVPYAAVIGICTGVGNLIPFVGPVVGFASLIIVCLTQMSFGKLIIGAIILVIILVIDGNVINPKLLSANVEVHPILVFLALIAGGEVGGIVGMLVAVPCAALLKDQFEKYVERKRLAQEEAAAEAENAAEESASEEAAGADAEAAAEATNASEEAAAANAEEDTAADAAAPAETAAAETADAESEN